MKQCPFCKEEIQDEAIKCKHCGSMIGKGSASVALPVELQKWNWAAFLWGPIWAIGHNVWLGLLTLIPYAGLIMNVVLGIKGNQWAWNKNIYESIEQFNAKQKKWVRIWLIIFAGTMVIGLLSAIVIPLVTAP